MLGQSSFSLRPYEEGVVELVSEERTHIPLPIEVGVWITAGTFCGCWKTDTIRALIAWLDIQSCLTIFGAGLKTE